MQKAECKRTVKDVVILISNKIDFNVESITTEEKEVLHNDRRSFHQQF